MQLDLLKIPEGTIGKRNTINEMTGTCVLMKEAQYGNCIACIENGQNQIVVAATRQPDIGSCNPLCELDDIQPTF
ncbi:hypothetical protein D9M69_304520 [compost metagenome]